MTRASKWRQASVYLLIFLFIQPINGDCDSCSLSLYCWMRGGQREEASSCSGPSWLFSCCVLPQTRSDVIPVPKQFLSAPKPPEESIGGLRSASLGGFISNSLEELASLGRQDDSRAFGDPYPFRLHNPPPPRNRKIRPQALLGPGIKQKPGFSSFSQQHRFFTKPKQAPTAGSPLSSNPFQLSPPFPLPLNQPYAKKNVANSLNHIGGSQPVCGVQPLRSTFQKRIIGGDRASFAEFPWQAHIRIAGFQCGGVLLNHQYIATAAHCVHRAKLSQIIIHLGEYDTKDLDKSEILPKETVGVVERKIHPQFKYMLTQPDRYDIAVLKLSRPVSYRDNILPICLPNQGKDYEGALGVVAGWGKTDTSFGKTGTNILQKVYVPIINNKLCYVWHEQKDIILELHDEMFCAGHENGKMDACLGDSGGPLVVNDGGRWTLVGITSAGFGCAVDHQPGIYHKVSKTTSWIMANIYD